jgi:cytochrome c oxidase subunit 1
MLASWLSSTDHKVIGHMYLITSFGFFLAGGVMAMIMRAQLLGPDNHLVSDQQYNELFTMHGAIMLLLFATPLFVGFANEIMPLQIGAPDVAFPRLNLLSYYFFLFGMTGHARPSTGTPLTSSLPTSLAQRDRSPVSRDCSAWPPENRPGGR